MLATIPYTSAFTGNPAAFMVDTLSARIVAEWHHRPQPSGLHAKLLRELSERSPYQIDRDPSGRPNSICVRDRESGLLLWVGHRNLMHSGYHGAYDPHNLLTRPASD